MIGLAPAERVHEFRLPTQHFEMILRDRRRAYLAAHLGVRQGDTLRFRELAGDTLTDRQIFAKVTHLGGGRHTPQGLIAEYWFSIVATENCLKEA